MGAHFKALDEGIPSHGTLGFQVHSSWIQPNLCSSVNRHYGKKKRETKIAIKDLLIFFFPVFSCESVALKKEATDLDLYVGGSFYVRVHVDCGYS